MRRWLGIAALAAAASLAGCGGDSGDPVHGSGGGGGDVTFNGDVAPLIHAHCSTCHRPRGSGPFDLLTYDDARKRARQIARVTESGFMPPWLPVEGHGDFAGARRLTAGEISLLRRWAESGAVEGDPANAPRPPVWPEGWQLGEPDLVFEMPRPYTLAAEGIDVYRNFVVPTGVDGTRWVRAVEFRPGNSRIVHHARLFVDRSGGSRHADARDAEPGYDGMEPVGARPPEGMLIGWTPGRMPHPGRPGMAWRLDDTTDLVLQLHLVPSGRPERIQSTVGVYLADGPPRLHPYALVLGSRDIDIAPGQAEFVVEDRYALPVDVRLLAIYPHAHYLGKTIRVTATDPDGLERSLLRIDDWDFNWQDEYHYAEPIDLPRGTTVDVRFTYDNSGDNPRNPHDPPRRVTYGARTFDEMAEVMLQVLPRDREQHAVLAHDYDAYHKRKSIDYHRRRLAGNPDDVQSLAALGSTQLALGRPEAAVEPLERAVRLAPSNARLRNNLGYALHGAGRDEDAVRHYREALALSPDDDGIHFNIADALTTLGRHTEALSHYRRVVELRPDSEEARRALARAVAAARGAADPS